MVCGQNSLIGMQFSPQGDSVIAVVEANPQWQGYAGYLHGGMISTLLDAAMTHCFFHHGIEAMTASLKVRFLEPVPASGKLEIKATLDERRRHVYLLNAELASSGCCLARAEARFIRDRKS
jgi:acyl-coenzyme A thioesterase PaaI-like protein